MHVKFYTESNITHNTVVISANIPQRNIFSQISLKVSKSFCLAFFVMINRRTGSKITLFISLL